MLSLSIWAALYILYFHYLYYSKRHGPSWIHGSIAWPSPCFEELIVWQRASWCLSGNHGLSHFFTDLLNRAGLVNRGSNKPLWTGRLPHSGDRALWLLTPSCSITSQWCHSSASQPESPQLAGKWVRWRGFMRGWQSWRPLFLLVLTEKDSSFVFWRIHTNS